MAAKRLAGGVPIRHETFSDIMNARFGGLEALGGRGLAVGVSGGPDSMALCFLLSRWLSGQALSKKLSIHALTVDHGLRLESAKEAKQVRAWVKGWPGAVHKILTWDHGGEVVDSRIQEEARAARYGLMWAELRRLGIGRLFLAHHLDDQAETVLFRLAHGSGLDGLCGMAARQEFGHGMTLCRPFLDFSKADLIATCTHYKVPFLVDPSNSAEAFARVRLRGSMAALEREGLTPERLSVTAKRLARARAALEEMAERALKNTIIENNPDRIVLSYSKLREEPGEIGLRVLLSVMATLVPPAPYGPRLERVEALFEDLMKPERFRKRTLNGTIFERNDREGAVILSLEGAAKRRKVVKKP